MRKVIVMLTLVAFTGAISSGQERTSETSICTDQFARSLVDQQFAESKAIEETDKRLQIMARAADLIWPVDEPLARNYFTQAFKVANDRFAEKGLERKESKGVPILLPDHRFQVIQAIARRDPVWARRLIEQVLKDYEKAAAERKSSFEKDLEVNEALSIAVQLVKTSPDTSWLLFRRVMRERLDYYWAWTLSAVEGSDRRFADALYSELLSNYARETPRRLLFLSFYPFGGEHIFGVDRYSYGVSVSAGFMPSSTLQQRFAEVFLRGSIAFASNPENISIQPDQSRYREPIYILSGLQELEPYIIRDFPQLLPMASETRAKASAMLTDEMRGQMNDAGKFIESVEMPFEARLRELEEADSEGRLKDSMILQTLLKAKTEPQFKMFEPWLDKVKDGKARNEMTSHFWVLRTEHAIKEMKLDDAQAFLLKIPEIEFRAVVAISSAEKRIASSDNYSGARLLADVGELADKSDNVLAKAHVLLGIATLYEKIDHLSALTRLNDAVRAINKFKAGDSLSGNVMRVITTPEMSYYARYQLAGFGLEEVFQELSKNDFGNAYSNAQVLDDKYYKTIAVFTVAKNCFEKRPKSSLKRPTNTPN